MRRYYAILFLGLSSVEIIARGFTSKEEAEHYLKSKIVGQGSGCFIQEYYDNL